MIANLCWDIDNTLIYTHLENPDQDHVKFEISGEIYYTIIRPCVKNLIEFSRNLVGEDNVFILTAATKEYAGHVNRLGEFGFKEDHIIAREDMDEHTYRMAYNGRGLHPWKRADIDNVLIDNLPWKENSQKIEFIGIWKSVATNYLKIQDYWGVESKKVRSFETDVKKFLEDKFYEK